MRFAQNFVTRYALFRLDIPSILRKMALKMGPSRHFKASEVLFLVFDLLFDFDAENDLGADDRGALRSQSFVFLANFSAMVDLSGQRHAYLANLH